LQHLDTETRALLACAGAVALGGQPALEAACRACKAAGIPSLWVDELLLQSVLIVGWPRALNGFAEWRRLEAPAAESAEDATVWRARGEAICREIYGKNYTRLRENIRALHPALDGLMVTEGYGRIIGRPGLDLARRELCVVVQVALQGAERQLHSHLLGALNAGASVAAVSEALELAGPLLGPRERTLARSLWERVRP
jgi:4-carboxymuconolactone decarboxylase